MESVTQTSAAGSTRGWTLVGETNASPNNTIHPGPQAGIRRFPINGLVADQNTSIYTPQNSKEIQSTELGGRARVFRERNGTKRDGGIPEAGRLLALWPIDLCTR